ncbi:Glycerophosphoryl diester phosphodiesterase [Tenacibaculum maritimum]|nr:Glycerophosphoryl diester phosphodiesterase [Tenacibaculum maritimum]
MATTSKQKVMKNTIIIAHRGASGYLPEHTMESKAMAYAMQPDFIEQDLVLSKDDIPIVIHDIYLDDVTNVSSKFPNKKRNDGRFYVIDFTFKEIQELEVTERFNPKTGIQVYQKRFPTGKSSFRLHAFQQEIELIQGLNKSTGKNIGIYPEIKNPLFHQKEGKDISKIVVQILADYGYTSKQNKCMLQCFDAKELKRIREDLRAELFLVQLIEFPEELHQLSSFATYADAIGPWYKYILDKKAHGEWKITSLVKDAHKLGLQVHPYTLRADQLDEFTSFEEMVKTLVYKANIDGAFTDFPDQMALHIR